MKFLNFDFHTLIFLFYKLLKFLYKLTFYLFNFLWNSIGSRSVILAAIYLMSCTSLDALSTFNALKFVRGERTAVVNPNDGFLKQLQQFEGVRLKGVGYLALLLSICLFLLSNCALRRINFLNINHWKLHWNVNKLCNTDMMHAGKVANNQI